jgi:hypothetical protein
VVASVVLGTGIGLAFAAITNPSSARSTSVFAATAAVSRFVGAALGVQVAAAIVVAAGLAASGFPAEPGITGAFVLVLLTSIVALAATVAFAGRGARTS